VRSVSTASTLALRLRELGLRPGARVRLAARGSAGVHIVAIGASRIAIDRATAQLIEVDPL